MALDAQTIATHEAGQAVMQWLVGWDADLQFIRMQRVDGDVVGGGMKIDTPNRSRYTNDEVARKKLLVLLAGAATTDDPKSSHNQADFEEACIVLLCLFGGKIGWVPGAGIAVEQEQRLRHITQRRQHLVFRIP